MTDLYLRKFGCNICKDIVVVDMDAGTQTCGCGVFRVPQWIIIDAYQRRQMLKNYRATSQEEIERLKRQVV